MESGNKRRKKRRAKSNQKMYSTRIRNRMLRVKRTHISLMRLNILCVIVKDKHWPTNNSADRRSIRLMATWTVYDAIISIVCHKNRMHTSAHRNKLIVRVENMNAPNSWKSKLWAFFPNFSWNVKVLSVFCRFFFLSLTISFFYSVFLFLLVADLVPFKAIVWYMMNVWWML